MATEKIRISIFLTAISIVFFVLLGRLYYIQISRHQEFANKAERNFLKSIRIPYRRGRILDRNGTVIADWKPGFAVYILKNGLKKNELKNLLDIIGFKTNLDSLYRSLVNYPVIKDLTFEEIVKLEEERDKFPYFVVGTIPLRYYHYPVVLSHITGYTGEVTQSEIQKDSTLKLGETIGKRGVEKFYNRVLRGKFGERYFMVDVTGLLIKEDPIPPVKPINGKDISLTIDVPLQLYIDSLMRKYDKGAVVVLNVKTGGILALYSKPSFNANALAQGISFRQWQKLISDKSKPLLDRAISGLYPPGSTFKPVSALFALKLGVVSRNTLFSCPGYYRFGRRVWMCWYRPGHGSLNLPQAIQKSCDVYFYQLGLRIGFGRFLTLLRDFNVGGKVRIDLPSEVSSFVPDSMWYRARYGKRGFGPGNVLNLVIGQGEIMLTPLKIATLTGLIANDGVLPQPHILKSIEEKAFIPQDTLKWDMDKNLLKVVKEGMWMVVNREGGTAYGSRSDKVEFAGKTGTSQNPHGKDHALFTAFAPYDTPEIVVTVVVEHGEHGSDVAPIAKKIIERYFGY